MTDARKDDQVPVTDLDDLVMLLGGSGGSFIGELCRLVLKADPDNRTRLARAFPVETSAALMWQHTPIGTRGFWRQAIDTFRTVAPQVVEKLTMRPPGDQDTIVIDLRGLAARQFNPSQTASELAAWMVTAARADFRCCNNRCPAPEVRPAPPQAIMAIYAEMADNTHSYGEWCDFRCLAEWADDGGRWPEWRNNPPSVAAKPRSQAPEGDPVGGASQGSEGASESVLPGESYCETCGEVHK